MTNRIKHSIPDRLKKPLLPLFLLAGLALFFLFGGHEFLSFSQLAKNYASLKAFVDGQLATALVVFGTAYILTVALSLPIASLLTLAGGALFGWPGAAVIICAATVGATIVFVAAQTALNEFFTRRTTGFMAKLEAGFQKNAFYYLLALRLIPAAPFWVVNIVPALLGMRLNQFMLATFIGITPGTLIYVLVAKSLDSLLSRGQNPDLSVLSDPAIIVPLFVLGLLSLIPALWKRLWVNRQTSNPENAHDNSKNEIKNS
tara:strand:- start:98 stop:874 length:777 start_codon:yes stop_codon:yes gene_type:complete